MQRHLPKCKLLIVAVLLLVITNELPYIDRLKISNSCNNNVLGSIKIMNSHSLDMLSLADRGTPKITRTNCQFLCTVQLPPRYCGENYNTHEWG